MRRTHQFHQLQNIHAHAHGADRVCLAALAARRTRLRDLHHELDGVVPHRGTVTLEGKADGPEEARRIKELMLKLLLNKGWIEDRAYVRRLRDVLRLL
jgi:hypothetical protein